MAPQENYFFYFIITPGLEDLAREELLEKWKQLQIVHPDIFKNAPDIRSSIGGLSISTNYAAGASLNHYLKIPTRILLRLDTFRSRDLPKLYERLRKIPWENYFRDDSVFVKASSHGSRLKIKERIVNTALSAIRNRQEHQSFRKKFLDVPQTVLIRIVDDDVTVSLDLSGEFLYLRGYKPHNPEAPLRETLAAALYFSACLNFKKQFHQIYDPFCGSGTLLFEAQQFWKPNTHRPFAFSNFPITAKLLTPQKWTSLGSEIDIKAWGSEKNSKEFLALEKNIEIYSKKTKMSVDVHHEDALSANVQLDGETLVITNPPYGQRIEDSALFREYIKKNSPKAWAVIAPQEVLRSLSCRKTHETTNGGLGVHIAISKD